MAEARKGRASMRDRMAGNYSPPPMAPPPSSSSSSSTRPRSRTTGSRPTRNEDEDLQKAIEESKRLAEQQKSGEDDLQRAIRMSQEEDERRKAELARNPNGGLFDSTQQQQQKPSCVAVSSCTRLSSSPYSDDLFDRDQLIDFDSNPSMMQPQPTGMMPQYTGMPNMHQFNSYNPFAAQQQAAQEEYMRMLEQQRQMEQQQQYQQMLQQQQYQQQQQTQQQQFLMAQPTGMPMQPQHTAQPMMPQPTGFGSNNPFAAFSQPQQPQQDMSSSSLAPPQQQSPPQPQPERPASQPAANSSPSNAFPKRSNANDERHADLAAMLGGGGPGIDTYGNVGNMRVPMCVLFFVSFCTRSDKTNSNMLPTAALLSTRRIARKLSRRACSLKLRAIPFRDLPRSLLSNSSKTSRSFPSRAVSMISIRGRRNILIGHCMQQRFNFRPSSACYSVKLPSCRPGYISTDAILTPTREKNSDVVHIQLPDETIRH